MAVNGKNGNGKKREETAARIIKAIHESNGLLTKAAEKAGVGTTTIYRYVREYPTVNQAALDAKEAMLDFTEGKLYSKIKGGNIIAILFYLKTQGKARGYIEKQEIEHSGGIDKGAEELSDEQLAAIIKGRRSASAIKETGSP